MKFVYPEFLYALLFLLIPIIIHLFNFKRYKTLYFSDIRFLSEVQRKSQSTSQLKKLLVLLSRMLLLASLVIAFAQPYWSAKDEVIKEGKQGIQLYIDNSFSMQAPSKQGILLDKAKQQSLSIIEAYEASDRFQIMGNEFANNPERWLNKELAIKKLQEIDITPKSRKISAVLKRFSESALLGFQHNPIYLVSDFQKSICDFETSDSLLQKVRLVLLNAQENQNISLEDLAFEQPFHLPLQSENLKAKVFRHGPSAIKSLPMKLIVDGELKAPLALKLNEEDSLEALISFQSGNQAYQKGHLLIKDYPISFDDTLFFNYQLKSKIKVVHIFEEKSNRGLQTLFSKDSLFDYKSSPADLINYSQIESSALLILDELREYSSGLQSALIGFIEKGGDLIFIPPRTQASVSEINNLLKQLNAGQLLDLQKDKKTKIATLNKEAVLFDGVFETIPDNLDLPSVKDYWILSESTKSLKEELISLQGGLPFLNKIEFGKGSVYLFASPLNDSSTTFIRHALFVPTFYNMALYSQERQPLYHTLGEDNIRLKSLALKESPVHIVGQGVDLIPPQDYRQGELSIELDESLLRSGHYELRRDEELLGVLSLNYSRAESDFQLMKKSDFEALNSSNGTDFIIHDQENEALVSRIQSEQKGNTLWKYFIIFALIFMGIEILLLRLIQ